MKETPISNCVRSFVTQAVKQNRRLDGRKNDEFRNLQINFGADFGSVLVALGETKVLGQVSCELGIPKSTRPHEGMMYINVELGPMAAPHLEAGRNSELCVQITRTLERTFKDSKCVDLESLCVTAEEKVWILRVDLNVLCHEGNVIDCCSIATLCALAHFKRPDVSIIEDQVHVHTAEEKEPIAIVLHHYPLCVSYCTFDDGRLAVADPLAAEERTSESQMIFGLNSYRELCCLNLGGSTTLANSFLLMQCAQRASIYTNKTVELIKKELEKDGLSRQSSQHKNGFTECLRLNKLTGLAEDRLALKLRNFHFNRIADKPESIPTNIKENSDDISESEMKWIPGDMQENEAEDEMHSSNELSNDEATSISFEERIKAETKQKQSEATKKQKNRKKQNVVKADSSDSEEEQTIVL